MEHYRSSHTGYDVKYHIVWIMKYRKPVLSGPTGDRGRELIREICRSKDVEIIRAHVSVDDDKL
ncbi:MAG: transposase [SAR324 cluster bacterium]|nr:transposase [SAR324 cluster bacterium]